MKRWSLLMVGVVAFSVLSSISAQDKTYAPNSDGFIRNWLVLLPISLTNEQGGAALNVEQIKDQAKISPREGDKIKIGSEEFTWRAVTADDDGLLNFESIAGADNAAAYAVCYVIADEDWKGKVKIGSDDQCLLWINGKEIIRNNDARATETDQNEADVTLTKGANVIVFKIIEEGGDWSCRLRFTDANNAPVTKLKISLKPAV